MDPEIWGPHLWFFLHSMSFTYAKDKDHPTREEKKYMYQFLESLKYVLPCVCKDSYKKHFDNFPPRLNSRRELFEWLVDLHNRINKQTNEERIKKGDFSKPLKDEHVKYKDVEKMYRGIYKQ
jgi:hypothetical protein